MRSESQVSSPPRAGSRRSGFWLFVFLTAVYLLSYSGGFHAIDEVSVVAMTESLAKHGQVTTDQIWWSLNWTPSQGRIGPDGHLYSKKGVGSALLGLPFYWLSLRLSDLLDSLPEIGAVRALMLANALVTALTGWLLYACVRRLGYVSAVAAITALGYGLGTMAWPYAKYFFSEPLTALGLMVGLWGLLAFGQSGRAHFAGLAGAGLGIAVLAKVANVVTWPLFAVYGFWMAFRRGGEAKGGLVQRLVRFGAAFLLPLAIAGLALAVYNTARTGYLLDLGYAADETFSTPLWLGLAGLLLSPGKGLFLYSPLLLAALFGIPALLRRDQATAVLSLGVVLVYPLLYAGWFMWWGGWSWGPRFLVPALPFLALFLAPVVDWALFPRRWWAIAVLLVLALLSFFVQILGVAVDFNQYLLLLYQRGIDSGDINFQAGLSPLLGHWVLLREGIWDLAWAREGLTGLDWPWLLWLLVLIAVVFAGWSVSAKLRDQKGLVAGIGRESLVVLGLGLLAVLMITAARLPDPVDDWQAGAQALSATLQEAAKPDDAMIVDLLPYANHLGLATSLLDRYKAPPGYWGWARQEPVSAERQAFLSRLVQGYDRLWLVLDTTPEGDPASSTERWLADHAFPVEGQWLSPAMRLVRYHLSAGPVDGPSKPKDVSHNRLDLRFGDRLWLERFDLFQAPRVDPGDVVSLSLFWRAEQPMDQDYVVFVQLLDEQGQLRAQVDRTPVGGFRPTSSWQPGEGIGDNHGLELPVGLEPGEYQLIAGLYLPATLERLVVNTADGTELGDYVLLTTIIVAGENRP